MDTMKRRRIAALIAAIVFIPIARMAIVVEPAAAKQPRGAIKLGIGQARFWDGEPVDRAQVPDPAGCGIVGPCWDYPVRVKEDGGSRLRVALTVEFADPQAIRPWADFAVAPENIYDLQILGPDGSEVDRQSTGVLTAYSAEAFVQGPVEGVYTARVIPVSVTEMSFRMRAKLEGAQEAPDAGALLPPNLRIIPPFEIGFSTPTSTYGPGVPDSDPRRSCMAEEIEEAIEAGYDTPEVCLRYSMGFENTGPGPFGVNIEWAGCPQDPDDLTACRAHQRLFRSDGTFQDQPSGSAGIARYHATHAHWHYQNTYEFQLLAVEAGWSPGDPEPSLTPAGPGRKLGVLPGAELMADWTRFYQGDRDVRPDAPIALQSGWGDIYEWNRSGNHAVFPHTEGQPHAGYYVLRGVTDPQGRIIESDESDNVGYAFIHVGSDGSVELLERGRGTDPWDPSRVVTRAVPG